MVPKRSCWMCGGDKWVEEPSCYYCERGLPHANCDDTSTKSVKCPVCYDDNDHAGGSLAKNKRPKPKTPCGAKL